MPIGFSPIITAVRWESTGAFSADSIRLHEQGEQTSPVAVLDDFRVSGRPFGPHPHAGFSALTYVFEDLPARARSRDLLDNDITVEPGGIVWFQAGRGAMHHEIPADADSELRGAQIFVKLSAQNKLISPRTFWLDAPDVPEWRNNDADRVRVAVGAFHGVASPLVPAEPFELLDVELQHMITFDLPIAHQALVYVRTGRVRVSADGNEALLHGRQALALRGGGQATFEAVDIARLLILSGPEQREPVVIDGPFIMNDRAQVDAAAARYGAGAMGRLAPLPEN